MKLILSFILCMGFVVSFGQTPVVLYGKNVFSTQLPANYAPTANAGADKAITLPTNSTTFFGSSSDVDGTVVVHSWTQVSGPTTAALTGASTATLLAGTLSAGQYIFSYTVTDDDGATGSDTVSVTVNPAINIPPVADAGANVAITLPTSSTTLTGTGTDADGTISSYSWIKLSGPSGGTIASPTTGTTGISALLEGTYQYQLTVVDNSGGTDADIVIITVSAAPANINPIANAGVNVSITLPVSSTSLTGSGTDADGTISSYAWVKYSGPTGGTVVSPTSATTSITDLQEGTYEFQLTVTDDDGGTATDIVQVIVSPAPNVAPVAEAGNTITITLPVSTATLGGSGTDADGTVVSYAWVKLSGPSGGTIATSSSASTGISSLQEGTYQYELTVTDDDGATDTDVVDVIVNPAINIAPVANAGANVVVNLPTSSTTLTGSGTDSDGTIASYAWVKISGPSGGTIVSPSSASTTINSLQAGTYTYQLTVTDDDGATNTDLVDIIVNAAPPANIAPVSNAGANIVITLPTNSTSLSGSGTDSDGSIVGYLWTKISGPSGGDIGTPTSASTSINSLLEGTYVYQLRVTDDDGAVGTDQVQVIVNPAPNVAPIADAGANITITLPTSSTTLSGSGSDVDGTIVSYGWTKISGPSGGTITSPSTATTTITSMVAGTYVYQLTVTDDDGATHTDQIQVIVNPAPNVAPTANAGVNKVITLPTSTTTFTGSGTDIDGTIVSYVWTKLSGPSGGTIASPSAATTAINSLQAGVYQYQLTVTDDDGATAIDQVQITVNPAIPPNILPVANAGPNVTVQL